MHAYVSIRQHMQSMHAYVSIRQHTSAYLRLCMALMLASLHGTECFFIRVRKCQECVRKGQSLASIARSLHIDWQTLQMYNPFLERPDDIKSGTVIATGPVYRVREGDFVESVAARFLVTPDDLLHTNPDVRLGNATLTVGLNLCVRTHVCNIKCKMHGSVCEATDADLVEQLARD